MKRLNKVFILLTVMALCACKPKPQAQTTGPGENPKNPRESSACPANPEFPGAVTKIPAAPDEKPVPGDWLVRRLPDEPPTLNPILVTDVPATIVNYLIMETMLDMDLATGDLTPMLAESYEISPDKLEFTFHLRKDVKWHDGKPFNADDVIYSFQRTMDPKVDSASLRIYFVDCTEAKKIDDYTVRFRWKQPYFKALESLGQNLYLVPKHILNDGTDFNKHPFGRKPVGTGPYKLVSWETGKRMELVKNKDYWGKPGNLDRIIFKMITDENVALQVFNQGELDTVGLTPTQWLKQTNNPQFLQRATKLYYDYPQFMYIGWNLRRPPFDDRKVRTAMTLMLDRDTILKNIFFCLGKVVSGPDDINSPYYDQSIKPLPYDPEKAKKLLDEAGWADHNGDGIRDKDGKDFKFELLIPAGSQDYEKIATIYKEDLEKKAGIKMEIRKLDWATFLKNIQEWSFDASMLGWALDPNPDHYQLWHSSVADVKGSSNHVGYKNPGVDKLIEQARAEFDKQKRISIHHQIHRILAEDQPYTFLFNHKELAAMDKRFRNVIPYPIRPTFRFVEWFTPEPLQKFKEDQPKGK